MSTENVTRFEVIDETGRALTRYGVKVELSYQDNNRTLKVFLSQRNESPLSADAVDPHADSTGKLSTREEKGM